MELNLFNHGHNLEISKDKLMVRYTGDARHANDVGAIQANTPVPTQCVIYYYEVLIVDAGEQGRIGIGFSDKNFKMTRQPGYGLDQPCNQLCPAITHESSSGHCRWEPNSYGYHADDGRKYCANGKGEEYGPKFTAGDTVGAGIHMAKQEMFFT